MPITLTSSIDNNVTYTLVRISAVLTDLENSRMVVTYRRGYMQDVTEVLEDTLQRFELKGTAFTDYMATISATYTDVKTKSYQLLSDQLGLSGVLT